MGLNWHESLSNKIKDKVAGYKDTNKKLSDGIEKQRIDLNDKKRQVRLSQFENLTSTPNKALNILNNNVLEQH